MNLDKDLYTSHEYMLYCLGTQSWYYIQDDNLVVLLYNSEDSYMMESHQMLDTESLVRREMVHKDFVELQGLFVVLLDKFY
jgi:hypothetical protein